MYALDNFYQSKEWVRFVNALKIERVNDNGELICAYCGKPITKMYDAIGHHTTYLTEDNINDYSISFNPDLIQIVHHRCHNKLHDKFGYVRRDIYLVYGAPLSGIREYVASVAEPGDLIIDINSIWDCLTPQGRAARPKKLNSIVFGARDFLIDCVKVRRGQWTNAYICGGYPLISERERICKALGAREIFIDATREECEARLLLIRDTEERKQYASYIDDWFRKYSPSGA